MRFVVPVSDFLALVETVCGDVVTTVDFTCSLVCRQRWACERVVCATLISARTRYLTLEYVTAARSLGVSEHKIILKHILPNALIAAITFIPFIITSAIISLTALPLLCRRIRGLLNISPLPLLLLDHR